MRYHRLALRSAVTVLATAGALLIPAAAQATTQTASSGGVTATWTYHGTYPNLHGETLTIKRGASLLYSAPVKSSVCDTDCAPGAINGKSIHVLDLEHNGTRDVVLELFSGGVHCCSSVQVFYPHVGSYKKVERYIGDPGEVIRDLGHNGRHEFLTANDVFAYRFTDYAASGFPIQILTFRHGAFHDVTRAYPKLIAADATGWLKAFKSMASSHYDDSEGVIAAWTADEYMLGHRSAANQYLNAQAKAGHLNAFGSSLRGHQFVVALQKFLKKQGY